MFSFNVDMQIRKHSKLKFLAIAVFCLELLAPTFLLAWVNNESRSSELRTSICTSSHNNMLSLFLEEEIEERNGRDDSHHSILIVDFLKSWSPLVQNTAAHRMANHQRKYQTQPLLFKKHCRYLI